MPGMSGNQDLPTRDVPLDEDETPIIPDAEEVNVLVIKPSFKSRKGRELNPKYFDAEEQ